MTKIKTVLFALSVSLALVSCSTIERSLNRHGYIKAASIAPPVCPSTAFIDPKDYELTAPIDDSEKEFKRFVIDMATKYPNLKLSYQDLRECWEAQNGKPKL